MGAGCNLPPFLTTNPNIRGIKAMADEQLSLFPLKSQTERICNRCGVIKPFSEFNKGKYKDGLNHWCRECEREYRYQNRDRILARMKEYSKRTKAHKKDYNKSYYNENKDKILSQKKYYYDKNRRIILGKTRNYVVAHFDEISKRRQKFRQENRFRLREEAKEYSRKPYVRKRRREYQRSKAKTDPMFRLNRSIASQVHRALKGAKQYRRWVDLAGYSIEDLRKHLEKQFQDGMTWENYGRNGWHVDHKIPRSVFNYTKPEHPDFKKAWAMSNLQPMWAGENLSKGNTLEKPFQPTLALEFPS